MCKEQSTRDGGSVVCHRAVDFHAEQQGSRLRKEEAARLIFEALLEEVSVTPKPGLVDRHDTGAHRDMDIGTFCKSAITIAPYLAEMYETGLSFPGKPEALFGYLKFLGTEAESAMLSATAGVNTHKGAIYTLGLISGALGLCLRGKASCHILELKETISRMCREDIAAYWRELPRKETASHGEILYLQYGEKGVRGEAAEGFPILMETAFPNLCRYRMAGLSENDACINTLLHIMVVLNDTNVISRGDYGSLLRLKRRAADVLALGGIQSPAGCRAMIQMNEDCVERNLSPGGAADLLAAAIFLWKLTEEGILKDEHREVSESY